MYQRYTVHFYRSVDDEYEGNDKSGKEQLAAEIQEAMDNGHCPAISFRVIACDEVDAPITQEARGSAVHEHAKRMAMSNEMADVIIRVADEANRGVEGPGEPSDEAIEALHDIAERLQ